MGHNAFKWLLYIISFSCFQRSQFCIGMVSWWVCFCIMSCAVFVLSVTWLSVLSVDLQRSSCRWKINTAASLAVALWGMCIRIAAAHLNSLKATQQMLLIVIKRFCIGLFSTLEQTHCTLVTFDSQWVTVTFQCVLNICQSGVLTALIGWYMAGAMWNCCCLGTFFVNHTTMHHVTSCKATYICKVHAYLPPAFLVKWLGSFMCYCGNTGVLP